MSVHRIDNQNPQQYIDGNLYVTGTVKSSGLTVSTISATTVGGTTVNATTVNATNVDSTNVNATTVGGTTVNATTVEGTTITSGSGGVDGIIFPTSTGSQGQILVLSSTPNTLIWQTPASSGLTTNNVTSSTTLDTRNIILANATSGAIVLTLPSASSNSGQQYYIYKTDSSANTVTIQPTSGDDLDASTTNMIVLDTQSDFYYCICVGSNGWYDL